MGKRVIKVPLSVKEKTTNRVSKEIERSKNAFGIIYSRLSYILREEVNHTSIQFWREKINTFQERGDTVRLKDFLIGAESTDPFNADAERHRDLAEWFVEQWKRFQGGDKVHVRGLLYAISTPAHTPDEIKLPNGKVFENDKACWNTLQQAGKYARYLGLISPEIFKDMRARPPMVYDFSTAQRDLHVYNPTSDLEYFYLEHVRDFPCFPDLPDFPDLPSYSLEFKGQQRYRIEVMIEKSDQEDVLLPLCRRYGVTLVTAQGEISISSMWQLIKRAERYPNTETVILYVSDFDPAGRSMPVQAARKIEFLRKLKRSSVHIRLYPIVLTHEQCIEYKLPRAPQPSSKKERRITSFELQFGDGTTELDALEQLHPGELARLVEDAIFRFRDTTVKERVTEEWWEIKQELDALEQEVYSAHDLEDLKEEFKAGLSALQPIIDLHDQYSRAHDDFVSEYRLKVPPLFDQWRQEQTDLASRIRDALQAVSADLEERRPDIDEYDMPEAEEVPLSTDCLYDSNRSYVSQLATYKHFAGKFEHLTEDEDAEGEDESA